ncbi:DUF1801 domain-containing protein [Oceanospirillaceae bacterium]|nr:DUF1801 domain-containing protein [Oceanospirillaceae bacterium]
MSISSNNKVNAFFVDIQLISAAQLDAAVAIRTLFLKAETTLVEDVKYGGLVFSLSDQLVGGIYAYKNHLSIEFSNGAAFSDVNKIMEGKGKKRRHIKIVTIDDLSEKNVVYFIAQALAANAL